jgi:hypothetical protein
MNMVQYLGYIIDEYGVHVDPTKIQVIRDWSAPTILTELQIFLGHVKFYRRFVLVFSHIAWALNQVTKVGGKEKFEIETDAFDYVVGAILTQHGHPIAYHSEKLRDTV